MLRKGKNAMNNDIPITKDYFTKRLADLCLKSGLKGFPKDQTDQQILLKSAMLIIGQSGSFTEQEINEKLDTWVHICQIKGIDRVTLRRRLVDTGHLIRSKDGASYQIATPGPEPHLFEDAINQLDIGRVIENAREEIARRKREYLEKARGV